MTPDLSRRLETLEDLRRFLATYFRGRRVRVILFGSRRRGNARPGSDGDLAFLSEENLSEDLQKLQEILEESCLPYKVVKAFLELGEGIVCASPRRCFRELLATGYTTKEETRLPLHRVDLRNRTVHTYDERVAEEVAAALPGIWEFLRRVAPRLEIQEDEA